MTRNSDLVLEAARRLGKLADEVVFIGGAAVELLLTDQAAPTVRTTMDVDVIIEVASLPGYYRFCERLRGQGFYESPEDNVICRWRHRDGLILDVMPTDPAILGFANRWCAGAIQYAQPLALDGLTLKVITAPYFLGAKIEAFHGRGNGDFMASHDMEDIIAVVDGRPELPDEMHEAPDDLAAYVARNFTAFLADLDFLQALPGHLPPDPGSQLRYPILLARLKRLAGRR